MVFFTTGLMQCIQKVAGNVSEPMMLIFVIPLQCPRSSVPMKTINVHQRTVQKKLVFSAGFPTSVVPFFKGAGFQVLKFVFCFGEVVWQLKTWILFSSKGIVFFHGSVTNSYGEYTIFGCFPKHPNQADQNTWRKTNHTELDMSRPSYRLNV